MKVLLLADINSTHTQKWAISLAQHEVEIGIFTIRQSAVNEWWKSYKNITLFNEYALKNEKIQGNIINKLTYFKLLPSLKKTIKTFSPDIVHAHYATSYGLLGALAGFHPYIISAWGSDVMDFPQKGFLYQKLLKRNFKSADVLLATSPTIVKYIHQIVQNEVSITPFGIDTDVFKPMVVKRIFNEDSIVLGTVKSLEQVYRIDFILKAFAQAKVNLPYLKLLIVGGGTLEGELKQLVEILGIAGHVHFAGKVSMNDVPQYHNMIDIFVNVSDYESFGVAVLEASACARPVIVTNVGGLKDVVKNNETGLIVTKGSVQELTKAMIELAQNAYKRTAMGIAGREFVHKNYELSDCVNNMMKIYNRVLKQ